LFTFLVRHHCLKNHFRRTRNIIARVLLLILAGSRTEPWKILNRLAFLHRAVGLEPKQSWMIEAGSGSNYFRYLERSRSLIFN